MADEQGAAPTGDNAPPTDGGQDNPPAGGQQQPAGGQPGGQQPPASQQPAGGEQSSWVEQHIGDEDLRGWLQSKGMDKAGPEAVAKSYRDLERMFGADRAGRTMVLPNEEASPEERMEVFDRLGRPETPDKYDLPLPENADENFTQFAREAFHKAGLTAEQAKAFTEQYTGYVERQQQDTQAQYQQTVEAEDKALREQWGQNYDKNLSLAKRAARTLIKGGDDNERVAKIDALEKALGYRGLMEFMGELGQRLGEDNFVDGDDSQNIHSARAKIQELESNAEFMKRYMAGDKNALDTMRKLHAEASGNGSR